MPGTFEFEIEAGKRFELSDAAGANVEGARHSARRYLRGAPHPAHAGNVEGMTAQTMARRLNVASRTRVQC